MKKMITACLLVIMMVLCMSCVEDVNLEATWTLVSLDDGETIMTTEDGTLSQTITLEVISRAESEFSGISGFSGVNHFNGEIAIEKNTMSVQPLALTMMIGPEEIQRVEDMFLKVFQEGGELSVKETDGKTILSIENSTNGTELQFVQASLENTTWNLSMFNIGSSITMPPFVVEGVSLAFSDDGKVYGSTGVNNIMGSYEFSEDGTITFSSLGTTRMAAPTQEAREFETLLLELLEQVTSFDISGQILTLHNASGETRLVYKR